MICPSCAGIGIYKLQVCIWCKNEHPDDVSPHVIYRYRKYQNMWCKCIPQPKESSTLKYAQNENSEVKQKHSRCMNCRKVVKIG